MLNPISYYVTFLCLIIFLCLTCCVVARYVFKNGLFTGKRDEAYVKTYIVPKNTQSTWSLAMSLVSAGTGIWVLMTTPETGVYGGALSVTGYALSMLFSCLFVILLGPTVRASFGNTIQSLSFVSILHKRYGRPLQLVFSTCSLMFTMMFLSAELASLGIIVHELSDGFPKFIPILSIATLTSFYTLAGGTATTYIGNRIQCIFVLLIGAYCFCLICFTTYPKLQSNTLIEASKIRPESIYGFMGLIVSVPLCQLLDQSMWTKLFSAKTSLDARKGFFFGGLLSMPLVAFFGFTGIVASAASASNLIQLTQQNASAAFFLLLNDIPMLWHIPIMFLTYTLVISTVDSQQVALIGIIAGEVVQDASVTCILYCVILGTILITLLAVVIACYLTSVLNLFLVFNLLGTAIVPAYLFIFWKKTTPISVSCAILAGLLTIPLLGWIHTHSFLGALTWVLMPNSLFHYSTMITFTVVPLVTLTILIIASEVHCFLCPTQINEQLISLEEMKTICSE